VRDKARGGPGPPQRMFNTSIFMRLMKQTILRDKAEAVGIDFRAGDNGLVIIVKWICDVMRTFVILRTHTSLRLRKGGQYLQKKRIASRLSRTDFKVSNEYVIHRIDILLLKFQIL
jgi:hypothetical protein